MADLEPVEPSEILPRAEAAVARRRGSAPWAARGRDLVAAGRRALAPVLPASLLAVAAVTTARAAVRLARTAGADAPPTRSGVVGPPLAGPAPGTTVWLSWTHVEVRTRR